jgi:hypothetical protein
LLILLGELPLRQIVTKLLKCLLNEGLLIPIWPSQLSAFLWALQARPAASENGPDTIQASGPPVFSGEFSLFSVARLVAQLAEGFAL